MQLHWVLLAEPQEMMQFPKWTWSLRTRFRPHSPIPVWYAWPLVSFWETVCTGTEKAKIFSNLFIYTEIWGSASVSYPPFHKHYLSAVWCIRNAEFLPEINAFTKEKGTSSTYVVLSPPLRPSKPTCPLQVSCSSTASFQTCLTDEIWQHHSLSWPNLFSLWDLTGSQLELPQEIWWHHSLRKLSYWHSI